MDIKHILVPSDFSNTARHALANAFAIAAHRNAKITLLHIVTVYDDDPYNPKQSFPDLKEYYKHLEERAGAHFEETLSGQSIRTVDIEYVIRRGFSPYEEILGVAAEQAVDLIALGTHGRKPLARFFLGSVAENIVHHAECPVLTVRIDAGDIFIPTYKKIVVPTDFSDQSNRALVLAIAFLGDNGSIDLLHVIEDTIHPAYFTSEEESLYNVLPNVREKASAVLEKMIDECAPKTHQIHPIIVEGRISSSIVDYAEQVGCDLIVMGTHGLNALSQFFIGSQANRVIRRAPCPVITIK
ncbi:universal stress protein [candidate division KSB1 bacterium]|nr:universal stress protein [candidate division KSB1 bacterium]